MAGKEKEVASPQSAPDSPRTPDDLMEDALDEMLEGVPEEAQQRVRTMLSVTTIAQRTSPQAELMRKMTSENIRDFMQMQDASDQRAFEDRKSQRRYNITVLTIGVVALLLLILILRPNPELLEKLVPGIIGLIAGAIGGYGYANIRKSGD